MQVDVDRDSGRIHVRRVVAAVDCGEAVNPDGFRNQIEGASCSRSAGRRRKK
jgi:CO/xanthine dehydrogenase Mo-binding subunit